MEEKETKNELVNQNIEENTEELTKEELAEEELTEEEKQALQALLDFSEEDAEKMIREMNEEGEGFLMEKYGKPFSVYRSTPGRSAHPGCVIGYAYPTDNRSQNFRFTFVPNGGGLVSDEYVNACAEEQVKKQVESALAGHVEEYVMKVDVNGHFCNSDDPEISLSTYMSENPEKIFQIYIAADTFSLMELPPAKLYEVLDNVVKKLSGISGEIIFTYADEEKLEEAIAYSNFFTKYDDSYLSDFMEGFKSQILSFEKGKMITTIEEFEKKYQEV